MTGKHGDVAHFVGRFFGPAVILPALLGRQFNGLLALALAPYVDVDPLGIDIYFLMSVDGVMQDHGVGNRFQQSSM